VTVTTAGDTSPPTAPTNVASSANGSNGIDLSWNASTDNVGVTSYRIERCQNAGCVTFAEIATSTGTTFSNSGLTANTSYSYRIRAADAAGNFSPYSNTSTATTLAAPSTGSGSLSGTWAASSGTIDLTTLGASDWVQWPSYERKSSGGKQISDFTPIGTSKAKSYADDRRVMMWTDGMPATTGSTNGAVLISGPRNGFQIVAPADTTVRTLTVYVSAQNATGTLTAQLSDGSAVDYANTFAAQKQASEGVYTLTYQAASAGQHITVKWMQTSSSGKAYVSLQGAALK
jgi:chitodextrinase